jgi:transcriptional regulator with AAA-type ATPase domain
MAIQSAQFQSAFDLLRKTDLFSDITDQTVGAFAEAMECLRYGRGDVVVRQGEPGNRFHILASGRMKVSVGSSGDSVVEVAVLGEGDCFGEMSLLTNEPASADVAAVEECETLSLDRDVFDALVAADPALLRKFVSILAQRLRRTGSAVGAAREKEKSLAGFLKDEKAELYGEFAGKHPSVTKLRKEIARLADADSPVLVVGEGGSGKEAAARLIHFGGERKDAPILSVDCAQITVSPWGDKLFGAFNGEGPGPGGGELAYMEFSAGGTIILGEIQDLPPAVQRRLENYLSESSRLADSRRVRVIATTKSTPEEMARANRVSAPLLALFEKSVLRVPSLRERKKDIPILAGYFLERHARRLEKEVSGFDDQAIKKMVSYDYRFANVRELKEAVERSVVLSSSPSIGADEMFLGARSGEKTPGFNWLTLPPVKRLLVAAPRVGRWLVGASFLAILLSLFSPPALGFAGPATVLVWAVWWPALMVSFLFFGRMWCSVCPMAFAGSIFQRIAGLERRVPSWMKEYDFYIMAAGFFGIMWVEEATGMRHSAVLTGFLLLGIGAGAVYFGVAYPRRSWCRHVCPLGGFAAFSSASAMMELRPTYDVCSAKCAGHACYKGNEEVEGCPMFGHLMFQSTNHDCVLCMNCVSSCPNDSPQFNLRLPGRELWATPEVEPKLGRSLGMMGGLLAGLLLIQAVESGGALGLGGLFASHKVAFISLAMVLSSGAALAIGYAAESRIGNESAENGEYFWRGVFALAPLITGGFVAYQLGYGLGLADVSLTLSLPAPGAGDWSFSFRVLPLLRAAALTVGLCVTFLVGWKIRRPAQLSNALNGFRRLFFAGTVVYWGIAVLLVSGAL